MARDLAVVLLLALSSVAFWYFHIIEPAERFGLPSTDHYAQTYPMRQRLLEWVAQGSLPLWNPYQSCGHPFAATVLYQVFYPLSLPFFLMPTAVAIEAVILLHLFLAGIFTYAFCRVLALGRPAALGGSVIFALGGFVATQATWFTPAVAALVWLPLGLIAVEKILRAPRMSWAAVLGVSVAMPILAGWLQTWVYTMYCLLGYAAMRLLVALRSEGGMRKSTRGAMLIGVGFALGVCLSAVQSLPTYELQGLGPRKAGQVSLRQSLGSGPTPPQKLLAEAIDSEPSPPHFSYLGIAPLLLMPLAFLDRRRRPLVVFFAVAAALSLCVSLTVHTPLFDVYRALPTASWFRAPQRILFLYAFSGAVLAAIGLQAIDGRVGSRTTQMLMAALTGAAALWLFRAHMPLPSAVHFALSAALICAATWVGGRGRRLLVAALLLLILSQLFGASVNAFRHPYHDTGVLYAEQRLFDFVKSEQGLYRTYVHEPTSWVSGDYFAMPKQGTLQRVYTITDYEPLSIDRYAQAFRRMEATGTSPTDFRPFSGSLNADPSNPNFRFLDLMSVRQLVVAKGAAEFRRALEARGAWTLAASPSERYMVYQNSAALPRAYVAHRGLSASGPEESLGLIGSPRFDPYVAVVIEGAVAADVAANPRRTITEAQITRYDPERIELRVNAPAAGYLVLTDTFYPGWRAEVDGTAAPIRVANHLFRAVYVEAGRHTITFIYDPMTFKVGLAVTSSALLVLLVIAAREASRLLGERRRRHRGAPQSLPSNL